VVGVDGHGHVQPLLAAYRTEALRAALPATPEGTPLKRVLDSLRIVVDPVPAQASLDVDTPEDYARLSGDAPSVPKETP
jgi:CTP:molybdopterin cytidylyltransferase MocA